jgi:RNA polymerase sigma factor (sigma-70 family)
MAHEMTPPSASMARSERRARPQSAGTGRMSRGMRSDTFERLFEEHGSRLFSFLAYRTGNRALAEDLLSETFERVLRSRQRFDPRRGSERRWLYTIALNLLRDHARRQSHEDRILQHVGAGSQMESADPALAAVEHRDELYRALAQLSEDEREALALRFGADLKLHEVARVLGEGESAIEGRIYRSLRKLRAELNEQ